MTQFGSKWPKKDWYAINQSKLPTSLYFCLAILTFVTPIQLIHSSRGPVCVSTLLWPMDVCQTWISSLLLYQLIYLWLLPHAKIVTILFLRNFVSGKTASPAFYSCLCIKILFAILLCVIIQHSINRTSDLLSEFSCWGWHLHTGRSACSAPDSLSESLESTGEANTIFRNGLSLVGISHSSKEVPKRYSAYVFMTEMVN